MATNDVYSVQVVSRVLGTLCMNNFHYLTVLDPTNAVNDTFMQGIVATTLANQMIDILSSSSTVIGWKAYKVSGANPNRHRGLPQSGVWSGSTLPVRLCYSIKLYPLSRGVQPGYKHISGIPQAQVTGDILSSALLSQLTAFCSVIMTGYVSAIVPYNVQPCVWTRPSTLYPTGRATLLLDARYMRISSQNSRTGRANTHLATEFNI